MERFIASVTARAIRVGPSRPAICREFVRAERPPAASAACGVPRPSRRTPPGTGVVVSTRAPVRVPGPAPGPPADPRPDQVLGYPPGPRYEFPDRRPQLRTPHGLTHRIEAHAHRRGRE